MQRNNGNQEEADVSLSASATFLFEKVRQMQNMNAPDIAPEKHDQKTIEIDQNALKQHVESIKPINAAIIAFQKRRNHRGSNSSLGSNKSVTNVGRISINDYYGASGNLKRTSNNKSSMKPRPEIPSPHFIQQKLQKLEQNIARIALDSKPKSYILESLPFDKQSDINEVKKRKMILSKYRMKKFSSTSTLFIDSCIAQSNMEDLLK